VFNFNIDRDIARALTHQGVQKMKNTRSMLLATTAALVFSLPQVAIAEESPGLVKVDIRGVAKNIAQNINVDVNRIPQTVEVQPWVAAGVCDVPAGALSAGQQGHATCAAKMTTTDLDQIVRRLIKGETR
jgi:hypothetical protein